MLSLWQNVRNHSNSYYASFSNNNWRCPLKKWVIFHIPETLFGDVIWNLSAFQCQIDSIAAKGGLTCCCSINIVANMLKQHARLRLDNHRFLFVATV